MGKITDIKQQAKRKDRVSVYVDGKYRFSLTQDQLSAGNLRVGDELGDDEITKLKDDSTFGKLRDNAFRWLSLRPRSEFEIDQYLQRKTDVPSLRDRVKRLLTELDYVDDTRFARSWIQHRTLLKPLSPYRIKQELLQKRVPKEIVDDAIKEADMDEMSALKNVIERRRHRYKDKQKLMAYLARQGYSYGLIKQALEEEDGN